MSTQPNSYTVRAVKRLIKPHLGYNPESGYYRSPATTENILATHGASVEGIILLATHGKFVRPKDETVDEALVGNEFYTTPNSRFPRLGTTGIAIGDTDKIERLGADAVRESIEYTWQSNNTHGTVVGLNSQITERGHRMFYETFGNQEVPELILPAPPSLHMIEGIYPVNARVEQVLLARLEEL